MNMSKETVVIAIVALALGVLRASGYKDEVFQAIAHLVVGGLFVAWRYSKSIPYLVIFILLCVTELACFVAFRGKP